MTAFGGSKETWYTNARAQEQYRKYIAAVVSRYKSSNAIFAWELANEPRCKGCNTDVIFKWASETSTYVKSLDPDHMVTLGDEGFGIPGGTSYPYGTSEGVDFVKNLGAKDLDFGTFHMYPSSCTSTSSSLEIHLGIPVLTDVFLKGACKTASGLAGSRTTPQPASRLASLVFWKSVSLALKLHPEMISNSTRWNPIGPLHAREAVAAGIPGAVC